jgi:RNase P/RNase MRP subunit p29
MNNQQHSFIRGLLIGVGLVFAVLLIFSFGVFVGEQKARFSYRWGENYHRFFGGPPIGLGRPKGFFGGHGTVGTVVKKEKNQLIIRGPDNAEKVVLVTKNTYILKWRQKLALKEIKVGDRLVVLGQPNKRGQIKAGLIRVFAKELWKESLWEEKLPLPSYQRL